MDVEPHNICKGETKNDDACKSRIAVANGGYCHHHSQKCKGVKFTGNQCDKYARKDNNNGFCYIHREYDGSKELFKCGTDELTLSERNEIAKNIFLRSAEKCDKGEIKEYRPEYYDGDYYFHVNLSRILINATSRGLAVFILMRYLDKEQNGVFQYYDELKYLLDCELDNISEDEIHDYGYSDFYDEDNIRDKNGEIYYPDNFIKKLEENGLRNGLFYKFVHERFNNDTLWLKKTRKSIVLTVD